MYIKICWLTLYKLVKFQNKNQINFFSFYLASLRVFTNKRKGGNNHFSIKL